MKFTIKTFCLSDSVGFFVGSSGYPLDIYLIPNLITFLPKKKLLCNTVFGVFLKYINISLHPINHFVKKHLIRKRKKCVNPTRTVIYLKFQKFDNKLNIKTSNKYNSQNFNFLTAVKNSC